MLNFTSRFLQHKCFTAVCLGKTKALIEMTDETTCQALNVPCFIPLLISLPENEHCEMQCNKMITLQHASLIYYRGDTNSCIKPRYWMEFGKAINQVKKIILNIVYIYKYIYIYIYVLWQAIIYSSYVMMNHYYSFECRLFEH